MIPKFDLDKIKFSVDEPTFNKAINLYEGGKVVDFKEEFNGFSAIVEGTYQYQVFVDVNHHDRGNCNCYLGQEDVLCKHMVAVAIYAILKGNKIGNQDKKVSSQPVCSGRLGILNKEELAEIKKKITEAFKYIKPYNGPSKTWFAYQNSLTEGCSRLSALVCDLSVNIQTAKLLVDILLKAEGKIIKGGIDDSDGTVGNFIVLTVGVLQEYARLDSKCLDTFEVLKNLSTSFGWEEPLVKLIK